MGRRQEESEKQSGIWENFCIVESIKKAQRKGRRCRKYFWRNYEQQEVDFIEEENGELRAYEFKYTVSKAKLPKVFKENYKADFHFINKNNFMKWFGK